MIRSSSGLHHITAFAGDPASNLRFYRDVLGLRLIKKTVNFDAPSLYHLYYGDMEGTPGSILTFFPKPGMERGTRGAAEAAQTAFIVSAASLPYWIERLKAESIKYSAPVERFGETILPFEDHDGLSLALVTSAESGNTPNCIVGDIPAEHAIRGLAGITLHSVRPEATASILKLLGFEEKERHEDMRRFIKSPTSHARTIDLRDARKDAFHHAGAGSVHHIAFCAADDDEQADMVMRLEKFGCKITEQRDRNYFRSVYFREPGGILFEIATNGPGFAIDEPEDRLGEKLMLPGWFEARRKEIEAALPPLKATKDVSGKAAA